jgi:hypothetical protein
MSEQRYVFHSIPEFLAAVATAQNLFTNCSIDDSRYARAFSTDEIFAGMRAHTIALGASGHHEIWYVLETGSRTFERKPIVEQLEALRFPQWNDGAPKVRFNDSPKRAAWLTQGSALKIALFEQTTEQERAMMDLSNPATWPAQIVERAMALHAEHKPSTQSYKRAAAALQRELGQVMGVRGDDGWPDYPGLDELAAKIEAGAVNLGADEPAAD